jgi:MFS family permease
MRDERAAPAKMPYYIILYSAFFIYTCNNVFMMATPLLIAKLGGTEAAAGAQAVLFLSAAILLRFFFGPMADTYGRRLTLLVGGAVYVVTAIGFLYAVDIWQVFLLRLVQAIGLAAYFPAAIATAAACAESGRRGVYIGVLRMVASMSLMVGPVVALHVIDDYGYNSFLHAMAAAALMGTLAIVSIPVRGLGAEKADYEGRGSGLQRRLNFLPLLVKCPLILVTTFVAAVGYGGYISFAALFVRAYGDAVNAGFFFTLFSLGGILANVAVGWLSDRFGRQQLTICALIFLGVGMLLFALFPYVLLCFYPAALLSGMGYYGSIVVLMAWMTDKVDATEHTAALSLQQNALDAGIACGSMGFGILQVHINSYVTLFAGVGVFYLIIALLVNRFGKK